MREILFRGKTEDDKWEYGYPYEIYRNCHTRKVIVQPPDVFGKGEYVEVIPKTVGQFTGLTDKNGIKIFEGDIVEGLEYDEEDGFGVVYWDDGAFWVGNDSWCGTFCDNYNGKDFEVIGNIHDNPELIGGADNG